MKITVGSDHRGFKLKEKLRKYLEEQKYEVKDQGGFTDASSDYPDFALPVAESVAAGDFQRGILVCGSGIGMCMTANKVPGIRAALVFDEEAAAMTARHNNPNILCLSGQVEEEKAIRIIRAWMETPFEGGRHLKRINKIKDIENKYSKQN